MGVGWGGGCGEKGLRLSADASTLASKCSSSLPAPQKAAPHLLSPADTFANMECRETGADSRGSCTSL